MGKVIISTSVLVIFFSLNLSAIQPLTDIVLYQNPDTVFRSEYDQIITTDSSSIIARVTRISNSEVFYVYPLNKAELSMSRKNVHQITYSTGRIEPFNPLLTGVSSEMFEIISWEQVEILNEESLADSLIEISDFDALYESNKMKISTSQLEKNAITILKKKTANVGGTYLLITNKIINKAYGDLPSIEMYGKAYRRK